MTLASAGVPVDTVTITGAASADVTYMTWATQAQMDLGAALIAAFDWSDAAETAWQAIQTRPVASSQLNLKDAQFVLLRGVVSVLVDEVNTLRQWVTSFKGAVAGAGTFAALKTAVAALPNTPDRTLIQARTAITNAVNSGAVDN